MRLHWRIVLLRHWAADGVNLWLVAFYGIISDSLPTRLRWHKKLSAGIPVVAVEMLQGVTDGCNPSSPWWC